jgi:hypothetical protein
MTPNCYFVSMIKKAPASEGGRYKGLLVLRR